jgi:hypothetical protein
VVEPACGIGEKLGSRSFFSLSYVLFLTGVSINTLRITLEEHLKRFEESKEEIKKGEKFWEITLETNIDFQKVLTRFYEYQPIWVRWQLSSYMKKYGSDPMAGYFIPFKYMNNQNVLFVLQAIIFLFFLIAGFAFIVC